MNAKPISKWTMILAVILAIVMNIICIVVNQRIPSTDEQQSILMLCGALILFFSPVYLSIWLDKIFGNKMKIPDNSDGEPPEAMK